MEKPLVSIIVPAYNAEKTIEKCLDSLLAQTLKEIEIIVINDNSTDRTAEILASYSGDKRIVLLTNEKNLGPAASRNRGLDIAGGAYIGFVDSDDFVDREMYAVMASKMSDEVDLVCCGRYNMTKSGMKKIVNYNTDTDAKLFSKTSNYNCDKLFKKEIIDKYGLRLPEKYSYAEDFAFGIRYKFYANKMCILQDPFYYYLADSEGSITNSYKANLLDIIDVLEDMLRFFRENGAFEKYESELIEVSAGFYARRIREFGNFDDKNLKRKFIKEFLAYFKRNFRHYKKREGSVNGKYYRFYRYSYPLVLVYAGLLGLWGKR